MSLDDMLPSGILLFLSSATNEIAGWCDKNYEVFSVYGPAQKDLTKTNLFILVVTGSPEKYIKYMFSAYSRTRKILAKPNVIYMLSCQSPLRLIYFNNKCETFIKWQNP